MKKIHLNIGDTLNLDCNFQINAKTKELNINIEELKEEIKLFIIKFINENYSNK